MRYALGLSEGTSSHHRPPPLCVQELHHKNRYWHEDCFRCAKCYKALAAEPFSARDDGKIMCGKCGAREDGNRCQGCYKVVMPGGFGFFFKTLKTFFFCIDFLQWVTWFQKTNDFLLYKLKSLWLFSQRHHNCVFIWFELGQAHLEKKWCEILQYLDTFESKFNNNWGIFCFCHSALSVKSDQHPNKQA